MASTTIGSSGVTFPDATTQSTAPVNTSANVNSATAVAGTGISITAVTTTGAATHTVTNSGVTSIIAGTGISVSGATGAVTVTNSSPGTTYSAGNGIGISGSTISVAAPTTGSVGSYAWLGANSNTAISQGSTTTGANLRWFGVTASVGNWSSGVFTQVSGASNGTTLSGTWQCMGYSYGDACGYRGATLFVRTV